MNAKNVVAFLRAMGADNIRVGDEWVQCSCPLARVTHAKHADERPSFGVSINAKGRSVYKCFSCSPDVKPLEYLLSRFWSVFGVYPKSAAQVFMGSKEVGRDIKIPELSELWPSGDPERRSITDEELALFPLLQGRDTPRTRGIVGYLTKTRQIGLDCVYRYKLRYWRKQSGVVVFPWTDLDGTVQILSLRSIHEKNCFRASSRMLGRSREDKPPSPKTSGAWFGLEHVNPREQITIVEGEMDCMRLATLGYTNVVAAAGKEVSRAQLASLGCSHLVVGLDADEKGFEAAKKLKEKAKHKFSMSFLDWSVAEYKVNGKLKSCKDPNDLPDLESLQKVLKHEAARPKCKLLTKT